MLSKIVALFGAFLATRTGAIARRVAAAFVVAFVASVASSGVLSLAHITDVSLWDKAALAGVAAALALIQSLISQWLAGTPELLPLLALVTRDGRCATRERKAIRHAAQLNALQLIPGYRFGKRPARPIGMCARLDRHLSVNLPALAASWSWPERLHAPIAWGMMLNDRIGDCTCAAVGHAIQLLTGIAKLLPRTLTDAQVLALYEAVSGYNPKTGANDNGAVEADVLARWRRCGVAGDKISAYGRVDHSDHDAIKHTIRILGFAYVGTNVPAEWEQAPKVWGVSDSQIVGGHAIIYIGWDATGFQLVSWGQLFTITYAAHDRYVDEVWGVVSRDWIEADGDSPDGIDLKGLTADLDKIERV